MNVVVQNGNLPVGFCPPDFQTMLNGFSAAQFVPINSISTIVISSTPPADHTVAWFQTDSMGNPVRIYVFANGAWLSPHPFQPGFTVLWNQVLPNFQTFDGGDANAPPFSIISGQMWQLMSTTLDGTGTQVAQAQFPVGVGTFPSTTPVAVGGTGGEEKHVLTPAEQGNIVASVTTTLGAGGPNIPLLSFTLNGVALANATPGPFTIPLGNVPPPSGHNCLPPFYGVYFLQRTAKRFFVV